MKSYQEFLEEQTTAHLIAIRAKDARIAELEKELADAYESASDEQALNKEPNASLVTLTAKINRAVEILERPTYRQNIPNNILEALSELRRTE